LETARHSLGFPFCWSNADTMISRLSPKAPDNLRNSNGRKQIVDEFHMLKRHTHNFLSIHD
jgi:hypothetical protein